MLDNLFNISFHRLDSHSLNALADYLEAQASMLRNRARNAEAQANGRKDRVKEVNAAGRDALDYLRAGVEKDLAIRMASTENGVPFINVEANMKHQLDAKKFAALKKQNERVLSLRLKGKTVRQVAKIVDLSPSRVSQIHKEKTNAAKSLQAKGQKIREISEILGLSIPCVSGILAQK